MLSRNRENDGITKRECMCRRGKGDVLQRKFEREKDTKHRERERERASTVTEWLTKQV